jgi:hypothetical protein
MTDAAERKMQFLFALRSHGVTDRRVLGAMEKIDRGAFVKGLFSERAYEDTPLPIACGQTISQPSVVATMTEALRVEPRDKVLEVGTACTSFFTAPPRRWAIARRVGNRQSKVAPRPRRPARNSSAA